ncbi:MAG: SRPBCC family protein [Chloroflexota bacterium]
MPILRERVETTLPIDDAFAFIGDFANSKTWDPGVATAERIDDGPLGVGSRFALGVIMRGKVTPMEYAVTTWEPPHRVVLTGSGSGVDAVDDIRFEASDQGTRIDYIADIRLQGLMRLVEPFAGGAFAKIGRDARDGMQRTLDELAAAAR